MPDAQCLGWSSTHLALLPCRPTEADDAVAIMAAWEQAFLGPQLRWYRGRSASAPAVSAELVGHGLVASAVKPAEQGPGLVLRALNLTDKEVNGAWRLAPPPTEAWLVRADESPLRPLPVEGSAVPIRVGPRAIATILVP